MCLQETNFKPSHNPKLKNYVAYHFMRNSDTRASGGTSIFISSDIYHKEQHLNTTLEAVAASVWCPQKITICSIYIPPNYNLTYTELANLIDQLSAPYILVGDFNSHNTMWGSRTTFGRGKMLEKVIDDLDLNLLNTGDSTHFNISNGTFSSIDLSLCDPITASLLTWLPLDSLYDSDHFPILITDNKPEPADNLTKWKISSANWDLFREDINTRISDTVFSNDINNAIKQLNNIIISSADRNVGKLIINSTKKIVPWWNDTCKTAVRDCKTALNRYRRTRNLTDFVHFKKLKAFARRVLKESKQNSWREYISTITPNTPPTQVWTKIRQIKGRNTTQKIPAIVDENNRVITNSREITNILGEHYYRKSLNHTPHSTLEPATTTDLNSPMNQPFTIQEMNSALSSMKNSAAGPDNIPMIFLKQLHPDSLARILELYNQIWATHHFPKVWRQSHIIPIKKSAVILLRQMLSDQFP